VVQEERKMEQAFWTGHQAGIGRGDEQDSERGTLLERAF
jgi:hypothetical protein